MLLHLQLTDYALLDTSERIDPKPAFASASPPADEVAPILCSASNLQKVTQLNENSQETVDDSMPVDAVAPVPSSRIKKPAHTSSSAHLAAESSADDVDGFRPRHRIQILVEASMPITDSLRARFVSLLSTELRASFEQVSLSQSVARPALAPASVVGDTTLVETAAPTIDHKFSSQHAQSDLPSSSLPFPTAAGRVREAIADDTMDAPTPELPPAGQAVKKNLLSSSGSVAEESEQTFSQPQTQMHYNLVVSLLIIETHAC